MHTWLQVTATQVLAVASSYVLPYQQGKFFIVFPPPDSEGAANESSEDSTQDNTGDPDLPGPSVVVVPGISEPRQSSLPGRFDHNSNIPNAYFFLAIIHFTFGVTMDAIMNEERFMWTPP
eukprot:scaffold85062_cov22-Prasinocladus_malaysianus.AAC.2